MENEKKKEEEKEEERGREDKDYWGSSIIKTFLRGEKGCFEMGVLWAVYVASFHRQDLGWILCHPLFA